MAGARSSGADGSPRRRETRPAHNRQLVILTPPVKKCGRFCFPRLRFGSQLGLHLGLSARPPPHLVPTSSFPILSHTMYLLGSLE